MVLFRAMGRCNRDLLLNKKLTILVFLLGLFTLPILALVYFYLFSYLPEYSYYKLFWRVERAQYHDEERCEIILLTIIRNLKKWKIYFWKIEVGSFRSKE